LKKKKVIVMEYFLNSRPMRVSLSDIDLSPGPFCMSFQFNLERLKASIERFGVLNPPYLVRHSPFTVVAGYRRLLAVSELGWHDMPCRILPDDIPPREALLLNLFDNLTARQFNPVEKGMVLSRLARYLTKEEILRNYMSMLDLPLNLHTLQLYLGLEDLDDGIKESVAMERLSVRVLEVMGVLSGEDQREINQLFSMLKWSFNLQLQTALWIIEIADREGRSVREVIEDKRIAGVAKNGTMNGPQKLRAIVREIREWRFPTILEYEKSFKKGVSGLALPPKVRVIPPPFFEGIDYRLEIVFREGKELREKVARLCGIAGLEEITDFWTSNHSG
jgi:ParB-like chromosome segregation protein Spo0J